MQQIGVRLRTLDAIRLASALALGGELRTLVTYDMRLSQAAADVGLVPFAPGGAETTAIVPTMVGNEYVVRLATC